MQQDEHFHNEPKKRSFSIEYFTSCQVNAILDRLIEEKKYRSKLRHAVSWWYPTLMNNEHENAITCSHQYHTIKRTPCWNGRTKPCRRTGQHGRSDIKSTVKVKKKRTLIRLAFLDSVNESHLTAALPVSQSVKRPKYITLSFSSRNYFHEGPLFVWRRCGTVGNDNFIFFFCN